MAGLGADDQTLCAAILHDTVKYTPFTLTALRREFGAGVAALIAEHTRLDHLRTRHGLVAAETLAAIGSADGRVATLKMADRLHNELFDAALRSAGIYPEHRDPFEDRGDGLLALLHPVENVPAALLLSRVVPLLARRVDTYNTGLPPGSQRERQLRIRVVVHAGEVNYDGHGRANVR
jgi:HD domain